MSLTIGSKAPDFSVNDQDGKPVSLASLKGSGVVLYFYPKDMTPGCTAESCNLRDNYRALKAKGYEVLGVSTDSEKSHQKFIAKEKLPFRLLADTDRNIHAAYGTWVEKSMYGRKYMGTARVTFVIDAKGIIEDIITQVDTKNHAAQILKQTPAVGAKPPAKAPAKKKSAPAKKSPAKTKAAASKKTAAKKKATKRK